MPFVSVVEEPNVGHRKPISCEEFRDHCWEKCLELVNCRYSFVQLLHPLILQEIQQDYVPIRSLMWRPRRDHSVVMERQICRRN